MWTAPDFTAEWAFVACPSRLGHIKRTGPVTQKEWLITPTGVWIDSDDAAELAEITEQIWCFRLECYLTMNTVFYLDPTREQIAMQFGEQYEP